MSAARVIRRSATMNRSSYVSSVGISVGPLANRAVELYAICRRFLREAVHFSGRQANPISRQGGFQSTRINFVWTKVHTIAWRWTLGLAVGQLKSWLPG